MVLSSTLTGSSVHEHRRVVHVRTYDWPTYQINIWIFVMLLASSSILGVFATFLQTQAQMDLPVPWYLPYYVAVAAVSLAFLLTVMWLIWRRRLLPAIVMIGALVMFVLWMVGLVATSVELWGSGGVQSVCSVQVWNQNPHGTDVATLAWMQQRNTCQTWYLVFAMGLTGVIFEIWVMIISYKVYRWMILTVRSHSMDAISHLQPTLRLSRNTSILKLLNLSQCTSQNRIYENETGGRDVFALGGVIVKSTHLKDNQGRDYALADANEVAATALAKPALEKMGIRVPQIYFADKIQGRSVLVQERIPGVGLNVAWRYLAAAEKSSFKEQAREILKALRNVLGAGPTYIVADPDPVTHRGVQPLERDILFESRGAQNKDCALFHNDLSQSNLIVDRGKIVAVVDWEMAGFFTWDAIKEVHLRIRSPSKKTYGHQNLPQKVLDDIYFWNDLYD
ncbi:hypothetical protein PWT90_04739 [Aphanocladium album]|nr:hypothetical protein PWT90_04739 [Aphanocladium album]